MQGCPCGLVSREPRLASSHTSRTTSAIFLSIACSDHLVKPNLLRNLFALWSAYQRRLAALAENRRLRVPSGIDPPSLRLQQAELPAATQSYHRFPSMSRKIADREGQNLVGLNDRYRVLSSPTGCRTYCRTDATWCHCCDLAVVVASLRRHPNSTLPTAFGKKKLRAIDASPMVARD